MIRQLVAALAFVALATAFVAAQAPSTLTITMNGINDSGQGGTATITSLGDGVRVVVSLENPAPQSEPAQIDFGVCSDLGQSAYALSPVVNGSSTSTLPNVTMDQLLSRPYAVVVQNASASIGVSCGNVQQE
jgi:hypothetical protein